MTRSSTVLSISIALAALTGIGCTRQQPAAPAQAKPERPQAPAPEEAKRAEPVGIEMRNVRLYPAPHVILQVSSLEGRLISKRGGVPVFDDQRSFYIDVDGAEVSLDQSSLTALVNDVFAYDKSPLSDLEVRFAGGRIEQHGKLRKGVPIPFTVEADVAASGGDVRLHPVKVRAAGIPSTKLMDLFGIELDDLIRVRADRGVAIRDNDLFLTPSRMLEAPEVRGRVTAARVTDGRLWLVLGSPAAARSRKEARAGGNFLWFHGGRIRFGRLTMDDTDLRLIDADPRDPFDFNAGRYNEQLVAGYSRTTSTGGLRTFMPDYTDLSRPAGRLKMPPVGSASASAAPRHP